MTEVNDNNFNELKEVIEICINESDFTSIDFEFTGIAKNPESLFDTPKERYASALKSVLMFPPCQLGIACFKDGERIAVDAFSIPLFKRNQPNGIIAMSYDAAQFLRENSFDFNNLIESGVTYCNEDELAKFSRNIDSFYDNDLNEKITILIMSVDEFGRRKNTEENKEHLNENWYEDANFESRLIFDGEMSIRLCPEVDESGEIIDTGKNYLWSSPVTSFDAAFVVYKLTKAYHHLDFYVSSDMETAFRGVSEIIRAVSCKKVPLVLHNSLLDCMYLYHYFIKDLPESYKEFKRCFTEAFPLIIDTKLLASEIQDSLLKNGANGSSLESLGDFFSRPESNQLIPSGVVAFQDGEFSKDILTGKKMYHDAGFDALETGRIFVKMATIYAHVSMRKTKKGKLCMTTLALEELIYYCDNMVANRIPISLIDLAFCDLKGTDPPGNRPDVISIQKRSLELNMSINCLYNQLSLFGSTTKMITEKEFEREKKRMEFSVSGAYRINVKLNDGRTAILVATNTASTYARICCMYSSNSIYELTDEKIAGEKFTYEQRMTSWRSEKDAAAGENSSRKYPSSVII